MALPISNAMRSLELPSTFYFESGRKTNQEKLLSDSLKNASKTLSEVQSGLYRWFGIGETLIGGGSSRAILDHLYFESPLKMRDFDIFAVANRQVDTILAEAIGRTLESETLGEFSAKDLRPRPRVNPQLPEDDGKNYIAGYGFFWKQKATEVDLSLFHSWSDLELNGILDVDTIMIRVPAHSSLSEVAAAILESPSYGAAKQKGLIYDRFDGYSSWCLKKPQVVHWEELSRDPVQASIRIVRAHVKMGVYSLQNSLIQRLVSNIHQEKRLNRLQVVRNFLKVLGDPTAAIELKILEQLGVFDVWAPFLGAVINRFSEVELNHVFSECSPINPRTALNRFFSLLRLIGPLQQEALLTDLSLAEPVLALQMKSNLADLQQVPKNREVGALEELVV
ncbi:MAG: hypothetical protein AB1540_07735 [Bdellovibrionota bacterium]